MDGDSLTYSIDSGDVDGAFRMGPGATVQLKKGQKFELFYQKAQ